MNYKHLHRKYNKYKEWRQELQSKKTERQGLQKWAQDNQKRAKAKGRQKESKR